MENLWERIKQHPYIAVAAVLGVFILVYLLVGGSSSAVSGGASSTDPYAAEVAAATQLQAQQYQAQTAATQLNDQLAAQNAQVQGAITIAQIQAQQNATTVQAQQTVAQQQISATQESTDLQSNIYGQIQSAAIAANQTVSLAQSNNSLTATQSTNAAQQAIALAGYQASIANTANTNAAQESIYQNLFATQQAINQQNDQTAVTNTNIAANVALFGDVAAQAANLAQYGQYYLETPSSSAWSSAAPGNLGTTTISGFNALASDLGNVNAYLNNVQNSGQGLTNTAWNQLVGTHF